MGWETQNDPPLTLFGQTTKLSEAAKLALSAWKPFIAEYLVWWTSKKKNRDIVSDYKVVRAAGGKYLILPFGKRPSPYQPMDADALYGWAVRLPLDYARQRGDEFRSDIVTEARKKGLVA